MIELFEGQLQTQQRKSSKGNQLKWEAEGIWYKADYLGYEGLSEYVCSEILALSDLSVDEFVAYKTEEILYKKTLLHGCKSPDFLPEGWQLITIERLFKNRYGKSIGAAVYGIHDIKERLRFLCEKVESLTGLHNFGLYMSRLITIDALFLNEDRHTHNIAVLCDDSGRFHLCPVFDNGASLLSDKTLDYPMSEDAHDLMDSVKSKTICPDFFEALTASDELFGKNIQFSYSYSDVKRILESEACYREEDKVRIATVLMEQKRKYSYLFK